MLVVTWPYDVRVGLRHLLLRATPANIGDLLISRQSCRAPFLHEATKTLQLIASACKEINKQIYAGRRSGCHYAAATRTILLGHATVVFFDVTGHQMADDASMKQAATQMLRKGRFSSLQDASPFVHRPALMRNDLTISDPKAKHFGEISLVDGLLREGHSVLRPFDALIFGQNACFSSWMSSRNNTRNQTSSFVWRRRVCLSVMMCAAFVISRAD